MPSSHSQSRSNNEDDVGDETSHLARPATPTNDSSSPDEDNTGMAMPSSTIPSTTMPELECIDNDAGPDSHLQATGMEDSIKTLVERRKKTIGNAGIGSQELMEDEGPQFYPRDLEDENGALMKKKIQSERSEKARPPLEEMATIPSLNDVLSESRNGPIDTDDYVEDTEHCMEDEDAEDRNTTNMDEESQNVALPGPSNEEAENVLIATANARLPSSTDGMAELEAYPVEDALVLAEVAEPSIPWWKQRRTRFLLCIVLAIVVAFAIALGLTIPSNDGTVAVMGEVITPSPTTSFPSASPSSSLVPSSSPTSCANAMLSSAKGVDFLLDAPQNPTVALDGTNMVAVVRDFKTSTFYTIFYSLASNGDWIMKNSFHQEQEGLSLTSAALSGKTAFVAVSTLLGATVSVYEQNVFGFWEKVQDPFIDTNWYSFGWWVDVGPSLACVGDFLAGVIYLFRRDEGGKKWVQLDWVVGVGCSVALDTIAVVGYKDKEHALNINQTELIQNPDDDFSLNLYKYDEDLDMFLPLQDPILAHANGGVISQDYAVYSDWVKLNVNIYRREESNKTHEYTFHQQLDVLPPGDIFAFNTLALDQNILVVREVNHTRIFLEQNATWEEIITLDESFDTVHLSRYNLLATKGPELYSLDIEGCVPTPAQMPSVSTIIDDAPTACHQINITVVFDEWPYNQETSWSLQRISASGEKVEVKSYSVEVGDISHTDSLQQESFCLPEGRYEFTIYDAGNDGMRDGHYSVRTGNGTLIASGKEFGHEEATLFSIPFVLDLPLVQTSKTPSKSPSCNWSELGCETVTNTTEQYPVSQLNSHTPSKSPTHYLRPSESSDSIPTEPTTLSQQNLSALNEILLAKSIQLPDYQVDPGIDLGIDIFITKAECRDLSVQGIEITDMLEAEGKQSIVVELSGVQASCSSQWDASVLGIKGTASTKLENTSSVEMNVDIYQDLDTDAPHDIDITNCKSNLQVDGKMDIDTPNSFVLEIFNSYEAQFRDEVEHEVAVELGKYLCDEFRGLGDTFHIILVSLSDELQLIFI